MEIQGSTLKAINIALQHHFRYTKNITHPEFEMCIEALDLSVIEKKGEWRVSFAPSKSILREVSQKHKGMLLSLNRYYLTFVIRKSDYKLTGVLGSQ